MIAMIQSATPTAASSATKQTPTVGMASAFLRASAIRNRVAKGADTNAIAKKGSNTLEG